MKKEIILVCTIVVLSLVITYLFFNKKKDVVNMTDNIYIVPTFNDEIKSDTAWCATFNLI